jgi:hypothetical protein
MFYFEQEVSKDKDGGIHFVFMGYDLFFQPWSVTTLLMDPSFLAIYTTPILDHKT